MFSCFSVYSERPGTDPRRFKKFTGVQNVRKLYRTSAEMSEPEYNVSPVYEVNYT